MLGIALLFCASVCVTCKGLCALCDCHYTAINSLMIKLCLQGILKFICEDITIIHPRAVLANKEATSGNKENAGVLSKQKAMRTS